MLVWNSKNTEMGGKKRMCEDREFGEERREEESLLVSVS